MIQSEKKKYMYMKKTTEIMHHFIFYDKLDSEQLLQS